MTVLAVVLGVLAVYCFGLFLSYRRRFYLATARDQGYAIPTVRLADFHERFRAGPNGTGLAAAVMFIGGAASVPAGTTDHEAWVLSVLARDAHTLFEFGTATGKTAWLLACNSPPGARVFTLTLPPGGQELYRHEKGDGKVARDVAIEESRIGDFLYTGTDAGAKITQLYGDSKDFDHGPFRGLCDLVFVDGAHAHSYVMSDSAKAFEMVSPTGIILWHDYKRRSGVPREVVRALETIARTRPLVRLAGTHMVAWRNGRAAPA